MTPCVKNVAARSRRADARRGLCVLRRGQDCRPFPAPLSWPAPAGLRCAPEQVSLDEDEHFLHNQVASVATLRELFASGPDCRSRSLRNQRSPSPESSPSLRTYRDTSLRGCCATSSVMKRKLGDMMLEGVLGLTYIYSCGTLSTTQIFEGWLRSSRVPLAGGARFCAMLSPHIGTNAEDPGALHSGLVLVLLLTLRPRIPDISECR